MPLDPFGQPFDGPVLRCAFIGCGGHAFRNVYPALQFAPVRLVAVCDLDRARADAYAERFGAPAAYTDHREMLAREKPDAVFVVVGYDGDGRPLYPRLASDALDAGCHVWIEKPPAATVDELVALRAKARAAGRAVMVGLKKMFFPAVEKAAELATRPDFGGLSLLHLDYPQYVPTVDEMRRYLAGEKLWEVVGFLDHLCHPVSKLLYLFGRPDTLYYRRAPNGAGVALFGRADGAVATLQLTHGRSNNVDAERVEMTGRAGGRCIVVENNLRVRWTRPPEGLGGYGRETNYYRGAPEGTTAVWEPEFSLGQLYNKALFLLGYAGEVREFADACLAGRAPCKAGLDDAIAVTAVFEAFAQGPDREIPLVYA